MSKSARPFRPEQGLFLGFLALSAALLIADFFREPAVAITGYRWMMAGLLALVIGLAVWTLLGGLKAPASVFLGLVFLAFTYVAAQVNGVQSITVTMYILLIFMAVPLIGWGAALGVTVASISVVWVLAFFSVPFNLPHPLVHARNLSLVFAGVFLLVWWYSRQQRRTAEKLRQYNAELESRVEERTRQVLVSEKLATVGRLSAGLAHDLNTPLGAVSSAQASAEASLRAGVFSAFRSLGALDKGREELLDLLVSRVLSGNSPRLLSSSETRERRKTLVAWGREAGCDEEKCDTLSEGLAELTMTKDEFARVAGDPGWRSTLAVLESVHSLVRSLDVIGRGVSKMTTVVKSFQSLSRPEPLGEVQTIDAVAEVENALLLLQGRVIPTIELVRRFEPVRVRCRPERLGQVVVNLVTNALQALDSGGTLELSLRRDGAEVVFEVADTGPGVPEGLREKIFEPFFTTKRQGEGNGLGLDMARRLCREEGGSLVLEHRPGWTVFVVRLPGA